VGRPDTIAACTCCASEAGCLVSTRWPPPVSIPDSAAAALKPCASCWQLCALLTAASCSWRRPSMAACASARAACAAVSELIAVSKRQLQGGQGKTWSLAWRHPAAQPRHLPPILMRGTRPGRQASSSSPRTHHASSCALCSSATPPCPSPSLSASSSPSLAACCRSFSAAAATDVRRSPAPSDTQSCSADTEAAASAWAVYSSLLRACSCPAAAAASWRCSCCSCCS